MSPYGLARLVNTLKGQDNQLFDFKFIWTRLRVAGDIDGDFDLMTPEDGPWTARILHSNTQRGLPVVVFISALDGASRRYLVFRRSRASWEMLGNIDIIDGRYDGSPHQLYHRLITNGRKTWLALRSLGATGTGVYQIHETWYDISAGHPTKVLEYPIYGYFANSTGGVCYRAFGARITNESPTKDGYHVQISFWVTYDPVDDLEKRIVDNGPAVNDVAAGAYTQKKRANYIWNPTLSRFTLNKGGSELDQQEIDDVFSTGYLSNSKFLIYNSSGLSAIESHGSQRQRKWLETALNKIKNAGQ